MSPKIDFYAKTQSRLSAGNRYIPEDPLVLDDSDEPVILPAARNPGSICHLRPDGGLVVPAVAQNAEICCCSRHRSHSVGNLNCSCLS